MKNRPPPGKRVRVRLLRYGQGTFRLYSEAHTHPLITRLSPANHPLLVLNCKGSRKRETERTKETENGSDFPFRILRYHLFCITLQTE